MGEPADIGTELAALVVSTASLDELLVAIAVATVRLVPAAATASVALTAAAWSGHAVAADQRAARLEAHQRRDGLGPGRDALRTARPIGAVDLRFDPRWPALAQAAVGSGVLALRSVPMLVCGGPPIGVLTAWARDPAAFGAADRDRTDLVAGLATVAVTGAMRSYDETVLSDRLRQALVARSAIDQATGIVMARHGCSADQALGVLRDAAHRRGTTLQELAAGVVAAL